MAKKAAAPAPNDIGARKEMTISAETAEQARRNVALLMTNPLFAAARAIQVTEGTQQGYGALLDTEELLKVLRVQAEMVNDGNLARVEWMLLSQATALQSLFARLVERGMKAELLPHFEAYMRLALRAQAQSTRTLEVLATVKNPPVFAKQANIAQQQQVNNGPAVPAVTRARNPAPAQSKLLETLPDERLEFGTQGAASGADSQLATVGTVHRPQD